MTTENIQAACVELVNRLLCPEQFGYAVTAEVRDAARVALGRTPVEQSLYLNGTAALNERAEFEYSERASDLTRDEADSGTYHNPWVQSAWEGWQARALLSAPPADHVRGVTEMVDEAKPVAAEFLKLRFFRDLSDAQRMAVFEVFWLLPAGFDEALTHGIQYRLFSKMLAACRKQPAPAVGVDASDTKRLHWLLPVVTGADSKDVDSRTLCLGEAIIGGLEGTEAIDHAMTRHAAVALQAGGAIVMTLAKIDATPIRCGRMKCKWRGYESELLEVPNPSYVGIAVTNNVCPICKNKSYMHMTPGEIKAWERKKSAQPTSEAQP